MAIRNTVTLIFIKGQVFEKYHGQMVGEPGGGGEYMVQEGFGWSNGVILYVLHQFGKELKAPSSCPKFSIERPIQFDESKNLWRKGTSGYAVDVFDDRDIKFGISISSIIM